ncbi:MAG: ADP-ribosylation factor-like protein [Candidatus Helarchaeota archaeon]
MPSRKADGSLVFKLVYYGPSLAGKTTSVNWLYEREGIAVGELTSIKGGSAAKGDMGKFGGFFDRMTAKVGKVNLQVWSVAGRKSHKDLRKVILQGVDGIIFVWDAQRGVWKDNIESLNELISILQRDLLKIPLIIMLNKSDLPGTIRSKNIQEILSKAKVKGSIVETAAINGKNVRKAFDACVRQMIQNYLDKKKAAS